MEYENVKPLNSEFLILYRSYAFQTLASGTALKLTHYNFNLNINILQYPPKKFSIF